MSRLMQPSYWNGGLYHALSLFVKLFAKSFSLLFLCADVK